MGELKRKKAPVTPLRAKTARRRLVVELEPGLYEALEALAADQRREFKAQVVMLLETAVKQHEGRKRSKARRALWERRIYGDGE